MYRICTAVHFFFLSDGSISFLKFFFLVVAYFVVKHDSMVS